LSSTNSYVTLYEGVSKSFRTGHLERELQMVQLSAARCSCIAILWVSLVSLAAIILCVASQVFITIIISLSSQSGNFWIHPRTTRIAWRERVTDRSRQSVSMLHAQNYWISMKYGMTEYIVSWMQHLIFISICVTMNRCSSVNIVIRQRARWSGFDSRQGQGLSSPPHPDQIWGPPSLLSNGSGFLSGGKTAWTWSLSHHLHPVSRLRMHRAVTPLLIHLHVMVLN
jgi:hypothetical protein